MKYVYSIIAVFLMLFAFSACSQEVGIGDNQTQDITNMTNESNEGELVFAITDAPADLSNISELNIEFSSLEVFNDEFGWSNISLESSEFDLMQLREANRTQLMSNISVSQGEYSRIRLIVDNVTAIVDGEEMDVKLPSNRLTFDTRIEVEINETSLMLFDFKLNESLHVTGNGEYVMAPVIQIQSMKRVNISIDDNMLEIRNREMIRDREFGMDENGQFGPGFRIPANANITINETDGGINIDLGNRSQAQNRSEGIFY